MIQKAGYIQRTFVIIWSAAKWWTVTWVVLLGIQSVIPILFVILTKASTDSFVALVQSDWDFTHIETTLLPVVLLVFVQVLSRVISSLLAWVRVGQSEQVRDYISELIQVQALRLDISYYEQELFYNLMHRARNEARERPLSLLEGSGVRFRILIDDWLGRAARVLWCVAAAPADHRRVTGVVGHDAVQPATESMA